MHQHNVLVEREVEISELVSHAVKHYIRAPADLCLTPKCHTYNSLQFQYSQTHLMSHHLISQSAYCHKIFIPG